MKTVISPVLSCSTVSSLFQVWRQYFFGHTKYFITFATKVHLQHGWMLRFHPRSWRPMLVHAFTLLATPECSCTSKRLHNLRLWRRLYGYFLLPLSHTMWRMRNWCWKEILLKQARIVQLQGMERGAFDVWMMGAMIYIWRIRKGYQFFRGKIQFYEYSNYVGRHSSNELKCKKSRNVYVVFCLGNLNRN